MDIKSEFSDRLLEFMQQAQLTTRQLGKKIGVDNSTVCYWLRQDTDISLSNAIALAELFGCSLEYLFGRTDTLLDFEPHSPLPFYNNLKTIMKAKKISRYRMCIDLKKGHGQFNGWKSGADPRINTVHELSVYLDVTLDYLAGRER